MCTQAHEWTLRDKDLLKKTSYIIIRSLVNVTSLKKYYGLEKDTIMIMSSPYASPMATPTGHMTSIEICRFRIIITVSFPTDQRGQ
jgi:hypothetical protein